MVFNIGNYGAIGDASCNDAPAIQRAIDACHAAGGGRVIVPSGRTFLTGTVSLQSHVHLHVESGARLISAENTSDFPNDDLRCMIEARDCEHIAITENGCAASDRLELDGQVIDTDRLLYLRHHFKNAARAVAEGIPLHGYFVWSLLDNFEWAHGYRKRFGIIYVNYETPERTPKLSAEFYRTLIAGRVVL